MVKEVVLIGKLKSFMVNAVEKGMMADEMVIKRAEPSVTSINEIREKENSVYLFYITDAEDVKVDLLVYIKELIAEEHIHLIVIGNPQELFEVKEYIKESRNVKIFERPVDVNKVVSELNGFFSAVEKERSKKSILVVDDNPVSLRTMRDILSNKFTVYIVNSGVSAIAFLLKTDVDLILLDYEMPVVNGPQVLEMIKEEPTIKCPPVMFLTAKNDAKSVQTALALNPVKYLLKSLPPQELIATLEEYFATR